MGAVSKVAEPKHFSEVRLVVDGFNGVDLALDVHEAHRIPPTREADWRHLMADDFKIESSSRSRKRDVVWAVLFLVTLGVPLTWRKTQGGSLIVWIGYSVNLADLSLGIAETRALWMAGRLERCARDGAGCMGEFGSALGRLTFEAGALGFERPFLSPLQAFQAFRSIASLEALAALLATLVFSPPKPAATD